MEPGWIRAGMCLQALMARWRFCSSQLENHLKRKVSFQNEKHICLSWGVGDP